MDRLSRPELLKTVESQTEKISRYETRLHDVIRAYKSLLSEKEALEASVQVLSQSSTSMALLRTSGTSTPQKTGQERDKEKDGEEEKEKDKVEDESDAESSPNAEEEAEESEGANLAHQVATLSSSLATISAEKSRMESSFQADKKQLLQEVTTLQKKSAADQAKLQDELKSAREQLDSMRHRLREQQQQRDTEHADHAAMLRELQQVVATERSTREDLEAQLESMKEAMLQQVSAEKVVEYEHQVQQLKSQLETANDHLSKAEKAAHEPSVLLEQLQIQVAELKLKHSESLHVERQRAFEAENRLSTLSQIEEERAASLEGKLSELSSMVGRYDRLREQDQQAIGRLQDQLAELSQENSQLNASLREANSEDRFREVELLRGRIVKLKDLLQRYARHVPEADALASGLDGDNVDETLDRRLHEDCQQRYQRLQDEFSAYKSSIAAAQRASKDGSADEIRRLHSQLRQLRDRLQPMQQQVDDCHQSVEQHLCRVSELEQQLSAEQKQHQEALTAALSSHQQQLLAVQGARERAVAMLQEREAELEKVRMKQIASPAWSGGWDRQSWLDNGQPDSPGVGNVASPISQWVASTAAFSKDSNSAVDQAVQELLGKNALQGLATSSHSGLLHVAEQQHRLAAELDAWRLQRSRLEEELQESRERAHHHEELSKMLKEEVRRLERGRSRETASMEYLKNVVLSYMTLDGQSAGRQHVANAIATILHFSPDERKRALQSVSTSWWPAS